MADEEPDYAGFFAVRMINEKRTRTFAYGHRKYVNEVTKKWSEPLSEDKNEDNSEDEPDSPDFTHESALTEALSKAVDFGLSQYHVVLLISATQGAFTKIFIANDIVKPIEKDATLLDSDVDYEIYGLSNLQLEKLVDARAKLDQYDKGADAGPKASLLSIVANFDSLIVDIVGKMIRLNPERYASKDREISVQEIFKYANYEDLTRAIISDEMYRFSRESHEEQTKYITKNFGISIIDNWKRWPDFVEVFERRNLVAHGEALFNQKYVDKCLACKHKGSEKLLGEKVELHIGYLLQSLDLLVEYSILLAFSLWRKQCPEKERQAFENLNEAVYKLIFNGRHILAARICEFALSLKGVDVSDQTRRMIVVNYASALRHADQNEKATKVLDDHDWSACGQEFEICVAAIKNDLNTVLDLIPKVKSTAEFDLRTYRTWPVFKLLHNESLFKAKLKEVYGEDLLGSPTTHTAEKEKTGKNSEVTDVDIKTVH